MLVFPFTYSIVSDSFIHCLSYIRFVSFITCLNDVSSCFGSSKITVRFQWRQLRWWWRSLKKRLHKSWCREVLVEEGFRSTPQLVMFFCTTSIASFPMFFFARMCVPKQWKSCSEEQTGHTQEKKTTEPERKACSSRAPATISSSHIIDFQELGEERAKVHYTKIGLDFWNVLTLRKRGCKKRNSLPKSPYFWAGLKFSKVNLEAWTLLSPSKMKRVKITLELAFCWVEKEWVLEINLPSKSMS